MFIKTVSTTSGINPIKFDETGGVFYWILNTGSSTIYASTKSAFTAGDDGVVSLGPKESRRLETNNDTIYILGAGQVEIHNQRDGICSFKQAPTSSGGGGTIDAYSKTESDAKYAQKTDIPTTLPANGGNADTISGMQVDEFARSYNDELKVYLNGQSGDIRALVYQLPIGDYAVYTMDSEYNGITFPIQGYCLISWFPSKSSVNDFMYGTLIIRPMSSVGATYICSVYNTYLYTDWEQISTTPIKSAHFAASTINGYIWTGIPFPKYVIGVDLGHFDVIAQFYKGNHVDAGRAEWTMMLFSKDDVTTPLNGSFNGVIYYID